MSGLRWEPLGLDHVPAWSRLLAAVNLADGATEHLTDDDLRDELRAPWRDPDRDGWIAFSEGDTAAAGEAIAFGTVDLRPGDRTLLRGFCWGAVHPGHRGRGVGRDLLRRQVDRARELVAARRVALDGPEIPGTARVHVLEGGEATEALLRRAGFELVRLSCAMRRDLAVPLPVPAPTPGVTVHPYRAEWSDLVRSAHNEAFADHWGIQPWTPEAWDQWETGHRDFRADWSFVAFDRLGVAGYVMSAGYEADWEADGFTQGWTSKLGVRPDRRRRGLGAALLATAMAAYRRGGMQFAGLDVDAENTSGAVGLYTGLGYEVHRTVRQWALPL